MISENEKLPLYLFFEGTNYEAYKFFSPHKLKGKDVWVFTVWAKNAKSVRLVGNFNNWDISDLFLEKIDSNGVFRAYVKNLKIFDCYKFAIEDKLGNIVLKADPFALHNETPPYTASKIYDISNYKWQDEEWINSRKNKNIYKSPMNIYEVHIGSWVRYNDNNLLNYKDFAKQIVKYVKSMNYTHIELLPITEYPYDGSWGYQVTGLFAPTSRYGTPKDFMYLVNLCHKNNIGIILDWVVSHFPKDEHGLQMFDGTPMYEYEDKTKGEHLEWGTKVFDYGKNEVNSFLISSAKFWLDVYHIDGIRVDAVASMIYLDYARKKDQWKPNKFGGNYNLEAIEFLKKLNSVILKDQTGVISIAEESTSFPMVTYPSYDGGLGFNFKWNMGWMNDSLSYIETDPLFRKDNHNKLTFPLTYAFSENYILPLSHDEVVHGKKSLLEKNFGDYDQKFEALKAFIGYFMTFPGKKLSFMGNEIAQFIEWNFEQQLDWLLLDYPKHKKFQKFIKDINAFYLNTPAMYEQDCSFNGFKWIVVDDKMQNILSYIRYSKNGDYCIVIINFSPITREKYKMGVPEKVNYKVVFASDRAKYGSIKIGKSNYRAKNKESHNFSNSINVDIPANSVTILGKI